MDESAKQSAEVDTIGSLSESRSLAWDSKGHPPSTCGSDELPITARAAQVEALSDATKWMSSASSADLAQQAHFAPDTGELHGKLKSLIAKVDTLEEMFLARGEPDRAEDPRGRS